MAHQQYISKSSPNRMQTHAHHYNSVQNNATSSSETTGSFSSTIHTTSQTNYYQQAEHVVFSTTPSTSSSNVLESTIHSDTLQSPITLSNHHSSSNQSSIDLQSETQHNDVSDHLVCEMCIFREWHTRLSKIAQETPQSSRERQLSLAADTSSTYRKKNATFTCHQGSLMLNVQNIMIDEHIVDKKQPVPLSNTKDTYKNSKKLQTVTNSNTAIEKNIMSVDWRLLVACRQILDEVWLKNHNHKLHTYTRPLLPTAIKISKNIITSTTSHSYPLFTQFLHHKTIENNTKSNIYVHKNGDRYLTDPHVMMDTSYNNAGFYAVDWPKMWDTVKMAPMWVPFVYVDLVGAGSGANGHLIATKHTLKNDFVKNIASSPCIYNTRIHPNANQQTNLESTCPLWHQTDLFYNYFLDHPEWGPDFCHVQHACPKHVVECNDMDKLSEQLMNDNHAYTCTFLYGKNTISSQHSGVEPSVDECSENTPHTLGIMSGQNGTMNHARRAIEIPCPLQNLHDMSVQVCLQLSVGKGGKGGKHFYVAVDQLNEGQPDTRHEPIFTRNSTDCLTVCKSVSKSTNTTMKDSIMNTTPNSLIDSPTLNTLNVDSYENSYWAVPGQSGQSSCLFVSVAPVNTSLPNHSRKVRNENENIHVQSSEWYNSNGKSTRGQTALFNYMEHIEYSYQIKKLLYYLHVYESLLKRDGFSPSLSFINSLLTLDIEDGLYDMQKHTHTIKNNVLHKSTPCSSFQQIDAPNTVPKTWFEHHFSQSHKHALKKMFDQCQQLMRNASYDKHAHDTNRQNILEDRTIIDLNNIRHHLESQEPVMWKWTRRCYSDFNFFLFNPQQESFHHQHLTVHHRKAGGWIPLRHNSLGLNPILHAFYQHVPIQQHTSCHFISNSQSFKCQNNDLESHSTQSDVSRQNFVPSVTIMNLNDERVNTQSNHAIGCENHVIKRLMDDDNHASHAVNGEILFVEPLVLYHTHDVGNHLHTNAPVHSYHRVTEQILTYWQRHYQSYINVSDLNDYFSKSNMLANENDWKSTTQYHKTCTSETHVITHVNDLPLIYLADRYERFIAYLQDDFQWLLWLVDQFPIVIPWLYLMYNMLEIDMSVFDESLSILFYDYINHKKAYTTSFTEQDNSRTINRFKLHLKKLFSDDEYIVNLYKKYLHRHESHTCRDQHNVYNSRTLSPRSTVNIIDYYSIPWLPSWRFGHFHVPPRLHADMFCHVDHFVNFVCTLFNSSRTLIDNDICINVPKFNSLTNALVKFKSHVFNLNDATIKHSNHKQCDDFDNDPITLQQYIEFRSNYLHNHNTHSCFPWTWWHWMITYNENKLSKTKSNVPRCIYPGHAFHDKKPSNCQNNLEHQNMIMDACKQLYSSMITSSAHIKDCMILQDKWPCMTTIYPKLNNHVTFLNQILSCMLKLLNVDFESFNVNTTFNLYTWFYNVANHKTSTPNVKFPDTLYKNNVLESNKMNIEYTITTVLFPLLLHTKSYWKRLYDTNVTKYMYNTTDINYDHKYTYRSDHENIHTHDHMHVCNHDLFNTSRIKHKMIDQRQWTYIFPKSYILGRLLLEESPKNPCTGGYATFVPFPYEKLSLYHWMQQRQYKTISNHQMHFYPHVYRHLPQHDDNDIVDQYLNNNVYTDTNTTIITFSSRPDVTIQPQHIQSTHQISTSTSQIQTSSHSTTQYKDHTNDNVKYCQCCGKRLYIIHTSQNQNDINTSDCVKKDEIYHPSMILSKPSDGQDGYIRIYHPLFTKIN